LTEKEIVSGVLTVAESFGGPVARAVTEDADTCSNTLSVSGTFRTIVRSFVTAPVMISTLRADV
jgi:hypothetical protein